MIPRRRKFQRGKGDQGSILSVVVGIILVGIVGYLAFSDWKIYRMKALLQQQTRILQEEIKKLEQRNAELERLLAKMGTKEYLEETARERLNLKKPGEEVVAIAPPELQEQAKQLPKKNFLQRILEVLPFLRD